MSEAVTSPAAQNDEGVGADKNGLEFASGHQSAGTMLKEAREARGLHIAALAVLLKVPVKKLEALESDRFDLLPDAVFVRALASSVCRPLKIDAATILDRLPQIGTPKLSYQRTGNNAPFRSHCDRAGPSVWAQVSRPAVLAVLVLLMGALILIFLPTIKSGINIVKLQSNDVKNGIGEVQKTSSGAITGESDFPVSQSAGPTLMTTSVSGPVSANPVPTVSLAAKGSVAASAPDSLTASAGLASGAANVSAAVVTTEKLPQASDVVTFAARTESWVEVADAKGNVILRRTLVAGDVVGASGELPLKIVVGRADATQVQIRGKAFDLNAVAKDNVAKFEVR